MVSGVPAPVIDRIVLPGMRRDTCCYTFTERTLPEKLLCTSVCAICSTGVYLLYEQYVDQQTRKGETDQSDESAAVDLYWNWNYIAAVDREAGLSGGIWSVLDIRNQLSKGGINMFCEKCGAQLDDNAQFCTACGAQVTAKAAEQPKEQYENVTGSSEIVNETPNAQSTGDGSQAGNAQNMNHAGNTGNYQQSYQQTNYQQAPNNGAYTPKSKMAAGLLGIFLGGLGIHNFYLGNTNRALIQLLVGVIGGAITCGLASIAMWIWGLVEGIQILSGTITTDAQGNPLVD